MTHLHRSYDQAFATILGARPYRLVLNRDARGSGQGSGLMAFVQSTLAILFNCGEFAAIPSLVGQDDLVAANGRIVATNSAGQIVGPILAGVLVTVMSTADLRYRRARSGADLTFVMSQTSHPL